MTQTTMEREIETLETRTEKVQICDECGREAEHELISKDRVESRLSDIEKNSIQKLSELDFPDIPEPVFEDNVTRTTRSKPLPVATTATVTSTVTWHNNSMNSKESKVINRNYDGIDSDEKELVKKAEELQEEKKSLELIISDLISKIRKTGQSEFSRNSRVLLLCDECYDTHFGWGDEDDTN